MIDYFSSFTYTNNQVFPDTEAVNVSGAGQQDGTEFIKPFVDDLWGARQALMVWAGLTPNSVPESVADSQQLDALRLVFGSPGMGYEWWRSDDPSTTGIRALYLNGQGILRANYPDLDAACYVGNGTNGTAPAWYRANNADGTGRNIAGIYLILPETRGYILRGLDPSGTIDPDGATRKIGSIQQDAFQGHHQVTPSGSGFLIYNVAGGLQVSAGSTSSFSTETGNPITDGVNGTPRIAIETRMKNVAIKWVVGY